MHRIIIYGLISTIFTIGCSRTDSDKRLADLFNGDVNMIDLTYAIDSVSPYWPGSTYSPFQLDTLATFEKDGRLSLGYSTPEHLGTHLDAPIHFAEGQIPLEQIAINDLFGPAVVVDVTAKCQADADYRLSKQDLLDWETQHGQLPTGAIVLMYTGWGQKWENYDAYKNADAEGNMHFPGFSEESARFLVEERQIKGIGIDNLSVDYGLSEDFVVHRIVNGAGKYHLENVANMHQIPPSGANLIIAPVKIRGGSGSQARIFGILPE